MTWREGRCCRMEKTLLAWSGSRERLVPAKWKPQPGVLQLQAWCLAIGRSRTFYPLLLLGGVWAPGSRACPSINRRGQAWAVA